MSTRARGAEAERRAPDPRMLADVLRGLRGSRKELSPKYFYDRRGSELFEEITALDEYYPTRTERALLEACVPGWVGEVRPRSLVELGAGSAEKTRVLLDAMEREDPGSLFVPLDVSASFLKETAARLREEYPDLVVEPEVADITAPLDLSVEPPRPAIVALLGSTIGNFVEPEAVRLLRHVRGFMRPRDVFLMGADLRPGRGKSVARLELAYDDPGGVTAEFNRNVLRVLNRECGADFDPDAFRHHAFWNADDGRIEMHLVAEGEQRVAFPDGTIVTFADGESVRTEISCKYDRPTVEALFDRAGMAVRDWCEDADGMYALVLADPA